VSRSRPKKGVYRRQIRWGEGGGGESICHLANHDGSGINWRGEEASSNAAGRIALEIFRKID